MKDLRKIVTLLLILMLVIPFAIPAASADDPATPAPGAVLYAENFETGTSASRTYLFAPGRAMGYSGGTATMKWVTGGSGRIGDASNHSIALVNTPNNWNASNNEMIPASAFQGLTDFTVSFDMIYHNHLTEAPDYVSGAGWAKFVVFTFPEAESGSDGNWVTVYWNELYNGNSVMDTSGVAKVTAESWNTYFDKPVHWELVYVAGAGASDSTMTVKMDGNTISTRTNAKTFTPYGLNLTICDGIIQLDNIQVTNDKTSAVVYSEDFEFDSGLFSDVYTHNPNFTGTAVKASTNGHALKLDAPFTTWQGHGGGMFMASFATKSQLQSAKKITLTFDASVSGYPYPHDGSTYTSYAYLHLGKNDEITTGSLRGVWVVFYSSSDGDIFELYNTGDKLATKTLDRYSMESETHFTVVYDSENKTFRMWAGATELFNVTFTTALDNVGEGDVMFGLNNRTTITLDNLLVTAGSPEDRDLGINFIGTQASAAVTDGKYAIRFVAGIGADVNLSGIREIGFKVVASYGAPATVVDYYANGMGACEYVYETILGSEQGAPTEYAATTYGEAYLAALTIRNIPVTAGEVTFTVTPYYITAQGIVTGASYEVVVANSTVVSQALAR